MSFLLPRRSASASATSKRAKDTTGQPTNSMPLKGFFKSHKSTSAGQTDRGPVPKRPLSPDPTHGESEKTSDPPVKRSKSLGHSSTNSSRGAFFLHRPINKRTNDECVICTTPIEGKCIRTPCGHTFDTACLLDLLRASTRDESLFPPTCCSHLIPNTLFEPYMDAALAAEFAAKTVEYTTPSRVYCARVACGRFLGARQGRGQSQSQGDRSYTCTACGTRTCSRCRCEMKRSVTGNLSLKTHTCRPDTTPQLLLESKMGREAGWVRCPGCERVVELQSGCYHVTCLCKTQFCYRCSALWRTCKCPWWDERQVRGEQVHDVDVDVDVDEVPPSPLPPPLPEKPTHPFPVPPHPVPVLPPVSRHGRMRETWIHKAAPSAPPPPPPAGRKHERASAPAELQRRVPHADIRARGVCAQERRRRRSEPEKPASGRGLDVAEADEEGAREGEEEEGEGGRESWNTETASYNGRMDALEEQIDMLLQVVAAR